MNRYRKQAAQSLRRLREQVKRYGTLRLYWDAGKVIPGASGMYHAATCLHGKRYFTTTTSADLEYSDITRKGSN